MESTKDIAHGLYGWARPFCALLARIRPPGEVIPEFAPCPAMPLLAIDPVKLIKRPEKSMPLMFGATPTSRVGAALYPSLNSFVVFSDKIPWRLKTTFVGLSVV